MPCCACSPPLLGIALAAAGVLVVIEVVAAWVLPGTEGGLLVPWPDWLATLASLSWNQSPVPGIAIGVGVVGLLLIIVGLAARRSEVRLEAPTADMTVTTSPRVLARLVGTRVRESDDVAVGLGDGVGPAGGGDRPGVARRAAGPPGGDRRPGPGAARRAAVAPPPPRRGVGAETRGRAMSVDLTKPDPATPDPNVSRPRRADARLRRRSRSAVARSAAGDRWLVVLIGLVLLAAGVGVTLLSYGVFGTARAGRPLLDPIIVDTVAAEPVLWRAIAIAGGIVLAVLGLAWVARAVRPEPRPDVVLDGGPDTTILVSSGAAADAVAAQAGTLAGVGRARARLVGSTAAPALRVTLWLTDDADVRAVLRRLDEEVLATARSALDLPALPVAVRLEVERPHPAPRVA